MNASTSTPTVLQTRQYIRFALAQLRARNGHHEFEELCRHVAEARIASNIIPATGPVSAGGDQGRDFETFYTYLAETPELSAFAARASGETIAFACTLQQDSVEAKILADVSKIVSEGTEVARIVVFTEADVPVAARHRVQDAARGDHHVQLEVLDGVAIASMLSDRELFWIAERYLDIPAEMYPAVPATQEGDDWYREAIDRWREAGPAPTYGDFTALKEALRHATRTRKVGDLPLLIARMEELETADTYRHLRRSALYEAAVASLRGLETLDGFTARLGTYFDDALDFEDGRSIEDAEVLLTYCFGAFRRGLNAIEPEQLTRWHEALHEHVTKLAEDADNPGRRCHLRQVLGALDLLGAVPDAYEDAVTAAMDSWTIVVESLEEAPLFPVDRFANLVSVVAPLLASDPRYRDFTQTLDAAVEAHGGRAAAAAKARDRAMAFFHSDQVVQALREFHSARINWFSGDAIRGSLLASALVAECYGRLRLRLAAKYYWLAVGILPLHLTAPDQLDFPARGVLAAAQDDYLTGAWLNFAEMADFGLRLHTLLDEDAWNIEESELLQATILSLSMCSIAAADVSPEVSARVEDVLVTSGLKPLIEEALSDHHESYTDISRLAEDQLGVVPFGDTGPERSLAWAALGITWRVSFPNDYDATLAAEWFVAMLQIVLADLVDVDLALMPTTIEITIEIGREPNAETRPSNQARLWTVTLEPPSSGATLRDLEHSTFAALTTVLLDASLLPQREFLDRLENAFEDGLFSKILPGQTFPELLEQCLPREAFDRINRTTLPNRARSATPEPFESVELSWLSTPGPTYTAEKAEEFLNNRYEQLLALTQVTRSRLRGNEEFEAVVAALHSEGWRDWNILSAMYGVAFNYRANAEGPVQSLEEYETRTLKYREGPEVESWLEVPAVEFSESALRNADRMNLGSTIKVWDLDLHQETPDLNAIERFLTVRYRHREDDIPHDDPFTQP